MEFLQDDDNKNDNQLITISRLFLCKRQAISGVPKMEAGQMCTCILKGINLKINRGHLFVMTNIQTKFEHPSSQVINLTKY